MQQHNQPGRARRVWTSGAAAAGLIALAALLAALALTNTGGSAHAAPQSGGPSLAITDIDGNRIAVEFDNWPLNEQVTLGYSSEIGGSCTPLPGINNPVTINSAPIFTFTFTWPAGVPAGQYNVCATEPTSGNIFYTPEMVSVNSSSTVTPIGTSTPTLQPTTGPGTPGYTPSVTGSATSKPGKTPTTTASRTPGNSGSSSRTSSNNDSPATLVAIILLCVLVLGLLIYLLRIWLTGRQTGP